MSPSLHGLSQVPIMSCFFFLFKYGLNIYIQYIEFCILLSSLITDYCIIDVAHVLFKIRMVYCQCNLKA